MGTDSFSCESRTQPNQMSVCQVTRQFGVQTNGFNSKLAWTIKVDQDNREATGNTT
jgi:hypothetical protein